MILELDQINKHNQKLVGGKAYSLAKMARDGIAVPQGICISIDAYEQFVRTSGLRGRILMEFHRKDFNQMRWEEIWDASLRIQNMFQTTTWPPQLQEDISRAIMPIFGSRAVVIRSSAPGEDSQHTSFAGLHESYVNIRGVEAILQHIKLVWASLWSDAALMYRRELGLQVETSKMAVLVQELISGEASGIVFSQSPLDSSQTVIESVYGLNQALVDGSIEPDRWILSRKDGTVISSKSASKTKMMVPDGRGVKLTQLPSTKSKSSCLQRPQLQELFRHGKKLEDIFKKPQDIEWTYQERKLYTLQSRPITITVANDDPRSWYMNLRRSFENLQGLRKDIQEDLIPQMIRDVEMMASVNLTVMTDHELRQEIERRKEIYQKWQDTYWEKFIPFAHGVRLFGQFYNKAVQPEAPYEFVDLLANTPMQSTKRNDMLEELAQSLREDPRLTNNLQHHPERLDEKFKQRLRQFFDCYGNQAWGLAETPENQDNVVHLLLEMATAKPKKKKTGTKAIVSLERKYFNVFPADQQDYAGEILDLARVSYQLRDDDNIYLGKIENAVVSAMQESLRRSPKQDTSRRECINYEEMIASLQKMKEAPRKGFVVSKADPSYVLKPRQLVGQPASEGIATGKARVISEPRDVFEVKSGEILVCDSIDPNMTFVIPLVAGIVERRGGMLIHGAIIAREYGVPCVTGVPDATSVIQSGFAVTVDGYLGIVT
ncbi:MAG: hypothetical protein JXD22_06425, partial [Sedimentisphaerales bacterium]|nr:hypothetical protein [Sedimentisphaerales bacterium]